MYQQSPDRLPMSTGPESGLVIKDDVQSLQRCGPRNRTAIRFSLALFLLLPFGLLFPSASNGAATTYQIQTASQGTFDVIVEANGIVQNNVYNLSFQASPSTIISEIDVKPGQSVTRGQILARLNPIPLQDNLNLANASVKVARANVHSAQAYAQSARDSVDAKIHAAEVSADAAQDSQNAVNQQSDTLTNVAHAIIQDDQNILDAQRKASDTLIHHAEVVHQQTITNCKVARQAAEANVTATPTPQTIPTAIATPTPTPDLTVTATVAPRTLKSAIGAAAISHAAFSAVNQQSANTGNYDDQNNSDEQVYSECVRQADTQYDVDKTAAHAAIVTAEQNVDKDQQALDQVKATVKVNNVNAQGQVNIANSLIDVEKADADYVSALTQVTANQGQLFLSLLQVNSAKHNLANTILIAPHDGVITGINGTVNGAPGIAPNSMLQNGPAPAGVFIQLVDLSGLGQITIDVAEVDILKIKPGQMVQFTLKAFGYRQFSARVAAIIPNAINNAGSIVYPVVLAIDASSLHGLKPYPNMTAATTIVALHNNNVLTIPSSALDFSHMMSTSLNPVLSQAQMQDAQHAADNMLSQMTQQDLKLALQPLPPLATFVIEQTGNSSSQTFEAKPVVLLGITNGSSYEVLQGLVTGEAVVTGITTAKKIP